MSTGEYESILFSVLDDDERELAKQVSKDKVKLLEEELALITIRERRMLQRIKDLAAVESGMTVVTAEIISSGEDYTEKAKKEGTLGQIQAIEDALTRVQAQKARLIELKHKFESASGSSSSDPDFDGSLWDGADGDA